MTLEKQSHLSLNRLLKQGAFVQRQVAYAISGGTGRDPGKIDITASHPLTLLARGGTKEWAPWGQAKGALGRRAMDRPGSLPGLCPYTLVSICG